MADKYTPSVGIQGGIYALGDFKPFHAKDIFHPTATSLPEDGIAEEGVMYFLGEITSISAGFPATAEPGGMVYISFSTGATAPTVEVITSNFIGIDTQIRTNCYYEIMGMWDGTRWVCVVHEVSL